eukprot:TRINITY_DN16369_c0_g2_i1.p1 TRINITY_DN16369_c0_g2~~TRINITY_DN16369_c0_g2_i1.p1  ORF type:complete len:131 (-),score=25.69 TRINITY_DN16369_c0_g2_i1:104-496(-)
MPASKGSKNIQVVPQAANSVSFADEKVSANETGSEQWNPFLDNEGDKGKVSLSASVEKDGSGIIMKPRNYANCIPYQKTQLPKLKKRFHSANYIPEAKLMVAREHSASLLKADLMDTTEGFSGKERRSKE